MATCGPRRQSVEAEKDLKVSSVQFSLVSFSLFPPPPLAGTVSLASLRFNLVLLHCVYAILMSV